VAKALASAFEDELVAIITVDSPAQGRWKRVRTLWRRYSIPQLLSRIRAKVRNKMVKREERRQETYARILFPAGGDGRFVRQDLVRTVTYINSLGCQKLLEEIRPDVIAVYGTTIIRSAVINKARKGILNMHTGLSPRYRGSDTIFWPLHNEEPEWVGVTIHTLDEGIDSGSILATATPLIEANDNEDSLFAKCVIVGTNEFVTAIRAVADGTVDEIPQDLEAGREYLFVDRTVVADRKVEKLLRQGLLDRFAAGKS
jgi:methionyl-tRNA formyltransferase